MSVDIRVSRYQVLADGQPSGWSELTEYRRSNGSVTYLMVESLGIFGPSMQIISAVGVEDGYHEAVDVEVERLGRATRSSRLLQAVVS